MYNQAEDQSHYHNTFKTRCIVNQRVYDVTIDGGNSENFVSKIMVDQLNLKKEVSYTLQDWLDQKK